MTLEELEKAKRLAASLETLLQEATKIEGADCPSSVFGYTLDQGMEGVLRTTFAGELGCRAAQCETDLRDLWIVFEGDPLPEPLAPVTFELDASRAA